MIVSLVRERARRVRAFALRWVARLSRRRVGVVLVLHGVAPGRGRDSSTDVVPTIGSELLGSYLRQLRRHYELVAPSRIQLAAARRGRGGRFPVALTFDDDLASHARLAAPLLASVGAPAAFFLGGVSLEEPRRYWWEDLQLALDRDLLANAELPHVPAAVVADARGNVNRGPARLAACIEELPAPRRAAVARALRGIVGEPGAEDVLDRAAVGALAASGFEIGFHTVAHERLPGLDDDGLDAALREGREALAAVVASPLRLLAYPHGRADARVAAAARRAGFELGFTGAFDVVTPTSDPLLLPRVSPVLTGGGAFAVQLARLVAGRPAPSRGAEPRSRAGRRASAG